MSLTKGQVSFSDARAEYWLKAHTAMAGDARRALRSVMPRLLEQLPAERPGALCIAGPPGSGKSTLAACLAEGLNHANQPSIVLSLDDYYLSRKARERLAEKTHPLLMHRGVPGTHDWARFVDHLDQLLAGQGAGLQLPAFDKSTDDVNDRNEWQTITTTPQFIIVEGWCLGAPAQQDGELEQAINPWEQAEDPDGIWRRWVNRMLSHYHSDLRKRISGFCYLAVPDWDSVIDWRWHQEQQLARPHLKCREDVASFLASFERIVKHMQTSARTWADLCLQADSSHRLRVMD
jgi:D-glycerate 3-kinase